jgi:hypothetical protein
LDADADDIQYDEPLINLDDDDEDENPIGDDFAYSFDPDYIGNVEEVYSTN